MPGDHVHAASCAVAIVGHGAGAGVQRQIGYVLAHRSAPQDALT